MLRYIDATKPTWPYKESHKAYPEESWDLSLGYEGARTLARDGWKEGARNFTTNLASLPAINTDNEWRHDVAGYRVDVPRFCAGLPNHMVSQKRNKGATPIVTIVVATCGNCNQRAQYMSNYGIAVARYVDELEQSGTSVELLTAFTTNIKGDLTCEMVTIKEAGDILDYGTISFAVGHPAFFRRLGFALRERLPKGIKTSAGYGNTRTVTADDIANLGRPAFRLNGMPNSNGIAKTVQSALAHIAREIAEQSQDELAA